MDNRSTRRSVSGTAMAALAGGAVVAALGLIIVMAGGSKGKVEKDDHVAAASPAPTTRAAAPAVRFTQRQRTTKALPGVDEQVLLRTGDVTGGKVKVLVKTSEGEALVEETAVEEGDVVRIPLGERALLLTVEEMRNALLGEDEVVFVLKEAGATAATRAALTEEQKIERLIGAVKELKGAKFIRNGGEHSAADAVEHMRGKWERGKGRIRTAREFIAHAASRSSLSGKAYRIRFADGTEVTSEAFLMKKLEEIEGAEAAMTQPAAGRGAGL